MLCGNQRSNTAVINKLVHSAANRKGPLFLMGRRTEVSCSADVCLFMLDGWERPVTYQPRDVVTLSHEKDRRL